jgi:hypothetical protein
MKLTPFLPAGTLQGNHEILRDIKSLVHRLPVMDNPKFQFDYAVQVAAAIGRTGERPSHGLHRVGGHPLAGPLAGRGWPLTTISYFHFLKSFY